jgi:hypothetical protein
LKPKWRINRWRRWIIVTTREHAEQGKDERGHPEVVSHDFDVVGR